MSNVLPLKILVILLVLAILFFSLRFALDPAETASQKSDEASRDFSGQIVGAINTFWDKNQSFPWGKDELGWTKVKDLKLDQLIEQNLLSSAEVRSIQNASNLIYLAASHEKVWACFAPVSKHERVDTTKLKSIKAGEALPTDGAPAECPGTPNWTDSICHVCVSK